MVPWETRCALQPTSSLVLPQFCTLKLNIHDPKPDFKSIPFIDTTAAYRWNYAGKYGYYPIGGTGNAIDHLR